MRIQWGAGGHIFPQNSNMSYRENLRSGTCHMKLIGYSTKHSKVVKRRGYENFPHNFLSEMAPPKVKLCSLLCTTPQLFQGLTALNKHWPTTGVFSVIIQAMGIFMRKNTKLALRAKWQIHHLAKSFGVLRQQSSHREIHNHTITYKHT